LNKVCKQANGTHQSPIDILPKTAKYDPELEQNPLLVNYDSYFCEHLSNTGSTFHIHCDYLNTSDKKLVGGPLKNQYSLLQFHAHWGCSNSEGSEHLVDNKSYAAEVFFVCFFYSYYIFFSIII
jgi:carbonic anhydrase